MRASQNALKSLELDRQRLASRGRSSGLPSIGTSGGLEDAGPEGDDFPETDMAPWRGPARRLPHQNEWRLVKNSQALLQVTKRHTTSPRGIQPEVQRSQDYQSFISKVLNSRWLMLRSTGQLRSLYGPLFGDGAELDRSKLLGVATQAVHEVKVSTAHTCWYEHLKPAKDEIETLNIKYKSLREQFHKARDGYLHEVTALRDEVRFRGNPEDGLPEVDVVYFLEPSMLLTNSEQDFALKVVNEKLKMIFEHKPASKKGVDVGQLERLHENVQSRELEDMRMALKRTMEKLTAAELALSDHRRQHHHQAHAHNNEVVGGFKERLVHALELQVEELQASLDEQRRVARAERANVEKRDVDVERYAKSAKEERAQKLLLQGKLNNASSQLSAYERRNTTLEDEVRSLNRILKANQAELKDVKAQLRRCSFEQMAICPSCGVAIEMEVGPTLSERTPGTPSGSSQAAASPTTRRRSKGRLRTLDQPQVPAAAQAAGGSASGAVASPRQSLALTASLVDTTRQGSTTQRTRRKSLGTARVPADNGGNPGDAASDQPDASTSIMGVSGIRASSTGESPSQKQERQHTASAVPVELVVTSEAIRKRESELRDALIGKEEALRRVEDLQAQRNRLKVLLHRHVRGLARAQSFRLLDDSDDLLAQAEALGCRKGRQAEASLETVQEAEEGQAPEAQAPEKPVVLLVDSEVQAYPHYDGASSTAELAAKLRDLQELLDNSLATLHGHLKQDDASEPDGAAPAGDAEKAVSVMEAQMEVNRLQQETRGAEAKLVAARVRQAREAAGTDEGEDNPSDPAYVLPHELDATKRMLASTQRLCEGLTEQVARLTEDNANISSTLSKVQDTLHKAADSLVDSNAEQSEGAQEPVTQCLDIITEAMNHSVFFPMAEGDTMKSSAERHAHMQELMQDTIAAIMSSTLGDSTGHTQAGGAGGPGLGFSASQSSLRGEDLEGESPSAMEAVGAARHEAGAAGGPGLGGSASQSSLRGEDLEGESPSTMEAGAAGSPGHEDSGSQASPRGCEGEGPSAMEGAAASRHEAPGLLDDPPEEEEQDDAGSNLGSASPLLSPSGMQSGVAVHAAGAEALGTADSSVHTTAESGETALPQLPRADLQLPRVGKGSQGPHHAQRPRRHSAPAVHSGLDSSESGLENGTLVDRFCLSTREPGADAAPGPPAGPAQLGGPTRQAPLEAPGAAPLRAPVPPAGAAHRGGPPRAASREAPEGAAGSAPVPAGPARPGRSLQPASPEAAEGTAGSAHVLAGPPRPGRTLQPVSPEEPALAPLRAPAPPAGLPHPGRPMLPVSPEAYRQRRSAPADGAPEDVGSSTTSVVTAAAQDAIQGPGHEPSTGLGEEELLRQLRESRRQTEEAEARCQRLRDALCQHVQGVITLRSEELLENAEKLSDEAEALRGGVGDGKPDAQPPPAKRSAVPVLEAQLQETEESLNKAMESLQQEADAGGDAGADVPPDPVRLAHALEAQKEVDRLQRTKVSVEAQLLSTRVNESQNSMALAVKAMNDGDSHGKCGCDCKGCACKLKVDAMAKLLDRALRLCSESTSKLKNSAEDNFTISSTLSHVQGLVRKASVAFDQSDVARNAHSNERLRECWEMLKEAGHDNVFFRLYRNRTRSRARRDERMQHMLEDLHRAFSVRNSGPLAEAFDLASPQRSRSPPLHPHKPKQPTKDIPRMAMMPERQDNSQLPTVSVRFDPDQHLLNQTKVGGVSSAPSRRPVSPAPLNALPDHASTVDKHRGSLPAMGAGHARRQQGGRSVSPNPYKDQAPRDPRRPASVALETPAGATRPRKPSKGRVDLRG